MPQRNLNAARKAKQDEFYTQLSDIENELKHYKDFFLGKVIYCNCDDYTLSNFVRYFYSNFIDLGIKKLITTCYEGKGVEYSGTDDPPKFFQLSDGDFRSQECTELLKQADIVVTNPPFSLFREYVSQLIEYDKKFLIIGNMNAITYKEVFPLLKIGCIWLGVHRSAMEFWCTDKYDGKISRIDKIGRHYVKLGNARWFTNQDHHQHCKDLILSKNYSLKEYPKYDNYDAINIDKTKDIPCDYTGAMGVPISFLDKHNPDQFDIVDANSIISNDGVPFKAHGLIKDKDGAINGKPKYARIVIKRRSVQ